MPSHRCKHPTCTATIDVAGYCPAHQTTGDRGRSERHAYYDQHQRDPDAKAFYNSAAWRRVRASVLAESPTCTRCGKFAEHVHHVIPLARCTEAQKLDRANLLPVCAACHNAIEAGVTATPEVEDVTGMLAPVESDDWTFDAEAAERPIRFVERYCKHYEGKFAGQAFILDPLQRQIVRNVYGVKSKTTGQRRFADVWFEAAVGAGKSPLLAALGLYGLMADGVQGAQVFSIAKNYKQAAVIFNTAKEFIDASPELSKRLTVKQHEIGHPKSRSVWQIISGKPRAGFRPSLVLADEIHDWDGRASYDALHKRMAKREGSLWISATNAGTSRQSLCWQLHEQAVAALKGSGSPTLYPIIWAAPKGADLYDPASWKAANPLLEVTTSVEKVRSAIEAGRGYPAEEAENRRLYLGDWVQGSSKWLNLDHWQRATASFDAGTVKDATLYIGIDPSLGDDLFSVCYVWVTPDRVFVRSQFWICKQRAAKYEQKDGIRYSEWAAAGDVTILDAQTISPQVRATIAAEIIRQAKGYKVAALCYDPGRAEDTIAHLETAPELAGKCVTVRQGWTLTPACEELERRLTDGTITVAPNAVLRFCAENVEVQTDRKGNVWPVKPNARGSYAGTRSQKIDGISALVNALTEARKHQFPAARKVWTGTITVV